MRTRTAARRTLRDEFAQAQSRDLAQLLGGDPELRLGRIAEPIVQRREHLRRASAAGSDQEHVTEPRFVSGVAGVQRRQRFGIGPLDPGLLLRFARIVGRDLRDARVTADALVPIIRPELVKRPLGGLE